MQSCPINLKTYDNNKSRVSSFLVFLLMSLFVLTDNIFIVLFVFADVLLRFFGYNRFSVIQNLSAFTANLLKIKEDKRDKASKQLAMMFGMLFLSLTVAGHFIGNQYFLYSVLSIYIACLFMDSVFDFCLGCKIYYLYKKFFSV